MRSRLGWTILYKSLYFVHPSHDLMSLFTAMRERSIRTMTSAILVQRFSREYSCVFNRNDLAFISSIRDSNIENSCICYFIFIFSGYNTNKINDQLPVMWLSDANWLEPCIGIAVRVNHGKAPIFLGLFKQLHQLVFINSCVLPGAHQCTRIKEILGVEPPIDDKVFKLIWIEAGGVIKINL